MTAANSYRTLFVGTLVQDSFLTVGGTEDPFTTVDSPFCRNGEKRPTLRGSGLAGALIATLRRLEGSVPPEISGSKDGRVPSVWRFFSSHADGSTAAFRQHVAIDARTGGGAESALFNVETLPPATHWPFLLEVDTYRMAGAADLARKALAHWAAGRCVIGGEVARGLGWMTLTDLREYALGPDQALLWPCAGESNHYPKYIRSQWGEGQPVAAAGEPLPGWKEYLYAIHVGPRNDGYGVDSLSIGGHASEELVAEWDERFLDRRESAWSKKSFDPDFAVVTLERGGKRVPYIPGSSLRGPLRHALARLCNARGKRPDLVHTLFGTVSNSAKLLIRDALPDDGENIRLAWMQHHAEDEFASGAYKSAKFDRIAVINGSFTFRMILEGASEEEKQALEEVLKLAQTGQIGIGGGQWRGHGWLRWHRKNESPARGTE